MTIKDQFLSTSSQVSQYPGASLVVVVKYQSVHKIQQLIDAGAKIIAFGRVQEAQEKIPQLKFSGKIHFIGRLQKNKVKHAVRLFDVIQSVDSVSLAKKISVEAGKAEKKVNILLQVNIANDLNKTGFSCEELIQLAPEIVSLQHVCIRGLMTIGKRNVPKSETRQEFQAMKKYFDAIESSQVFGKKCTELSMGMSQDHMLALSEGATMVRVGSLFFQEMKESN